jgi:type IV pilus assembly protein PilO
LSVGGEKLVKEFLERISTSVALALGLCLAFVYYFTPLFDDGHVLQQEIDNTKVQLAVKKKEKEKVDSDISEAKKIKERVNLLSEKFKQAVQYLPTEWKEDSLLTDISKQAQIAGVTVVKINTVKDRATAGVYEEMKIDFEIKGSFASTMIFISNVTKIKRIIEVTEILMRSDDPDAEMPSLTSTGKFTTYRYISPQERATKDEKKL